MMHRAITPTAKATLGPDLEQRVAAPRYTIRSAMLEFIGSTLFYRDGKQEHSFDFAELYFPVTPAHPEVTRLSDYPHYVDTLLAAADLRIDRSKGPPAGRALTRQIYLIRHLLDWLRTRGVYRLGNATKDHTDELLAQLALGGWVYALSLETRWNDVIDRLESQKTDLSGAFHFKNEAMGRGIETLLQPFWRIRLGWGGIVPLPPQAKARLEALAANWPATRGWQTRRVSNCEAPRTFVLRNIIGWLNDLAALPASVDRLEHRVAQSTNTSSKRLAKNTSSRTSNLQLCDAVTLLTTALKLLYETAPLLLDLYEEARAIYPSLSLNKRRTWLHTCNSLHKLEIAMGKKISTWVCSGMYPRDPGTYAVDEVLGAVQGACAIILAAMNARRQGEICDRNRGVRIDDLVILDDSLGLYQCWFYIEKTFRDRHVFYVNRTSADALRVLERLKRACSPFDKDAADSPSLFECGRFVELGPASGSHFAFTEDTGRTRSLRSFLKVAYDNSDTAPEVASHMFRRFYAILYYHRYEHAELRALKQHLRHLDVAMTRVYVTDPSTRPLAEQISTVIGKVDYQFVSSELKDSLESDTLDIQNALHEMGKEKLRMAIDEILNGTPTAGGFSKIVRKLYRQMLPQVTVGRQAPTSSTDQIIGLFDAHGYRVTPMQHGQCHAPDTRRNLRGSCEQEGILAREHASHRLCRNCPFHFNNTSYLVNLKEQLSELASEMYDFMLGPQQQARAQFEHQNLSKLLILTERQMELNSRSMTEISDSKKGFKHDA